MTKEIHDGLAAVLLTEKSFEKLAHWVMRVANAQDVS